MLQRMIHAQYLLCPAAGGLNRVTAEARFLSLVWFYLWGKTQVHSGSTDVPVLQWNWEAAHVCGSVRICPQTPRGRAA